MKPQKPGITMQNIVEKYLLTVLFCSINALLITRRKKLISALKYTNNVTNTPIWKITGGIEDEFIQIINY